MPFPISDATDSCLFNLSCRRNCDAVNGTTCGVNDIDNDLGLILIKFDSKSGDNGIVNVVLLTPKDGCLESHGFVVAQEDSLLPFTFVILLIFFVIVVVFIFKDSMKEAAVTIFTSSLSLTITSFVLYELTLRSPLAYV